jgi:hypothetical protein
VSTQTVFEYYVELETPFVLDPDTIYWISIQAVNDDGAPIQWGWQESTDHWNDLAVQLSEQFGPVVGTWTFLPGEDMAFELVMIPIPASVFLLGAGLIALIGIRRRSMS